MNGCLEHYKGLANNFFTGLQDRIDTAIDGLMPELAKVTFSNPVAASVSGPQPGGIPGGVSAPQAAAFDLAEFVNSARASWLLDKILSYFSGDTQVAPIQPLQNAMDELAVAVRDGLAFAEDIGTVLWTGLQAMSSSRGSYDQATFAQFFQALKDAVADLLGFADAVVNAVLDLVEAVMDQLGALLAHQFDEIPVIGGLLNKLGVDDTMSVAHLVSMVLMYPATLANRIKNGSSSSLFPTSAATATKRLAAAELDWALGLQMSASVGQGTWGIIDMIGDAAAAAKQAPPAFVGWTDIVAPCILNILQWPGTRHWRAVPERHRRVGLRRFPDRAHLAGRLGTARRRAVRQGRRLRARSAIGHPARARAPADIPRNRHVLHRRLSRRRHHHRQHLQLPGRPEQGNPGRRHPGERLQHRRALPDLRGHRNKRRHFRARQAHPRRSRQHGRCRRDEPQLIR